MAKQSKITFNLKGLENLTSQMKGYKARVGIIGDKAAQDHTLIEHGHRRGKHRTSATSITNAEIGLIQITGSITNNIPPRDFLLFPVEHKRKEIMKEMNSASVRTAIARGDIKKIFQLLGVAAEMVIQEAFYSAGFGQWPPNAPATIDKKGSSAPLIDTAQLRRAITSEVVKKGIVQ